jgi:hypothetical protein
LLVVQRVPSNEGGGEKEALRTIEPVIYCVVPKELEAELYDRLVDYYKDNPNVEVVVDRREGSDRRAGRKGGGNREIRDRRRSRAPGTFLTTEPPETA